MSQQHSIYKRLIPWLFVLCSLLGFAAQAEQTPIAVKGVLDLRHWNFATQEPIEMLGEWEFYWKQFLNQENLPLVRYSKPDAYLSVPNTWNGLGLADGSVIEGPGFATLRLTILLPSSFSTTHLKFLRIVVRPINSPYEMQVLDSTGKPLSELMHSGDLNQELIIPPKHAQSLPVLSNPELIVIWRISNHKNHAVAGPWRVPKLGEEAAIVSKLKINHSIDFLLIGIALAAGIYHWIMFLLRPKDREAFWFGLFCLCIAFVVFYVNEHIGDFFGDEFDYSHLQRLLVSLVNLDIIALICFLGNIIPQHTKSIISKALIISCFFYIFSVWVFPFNETMFVFFNYFLPIQHSLLMLWICYVSLSAFLRELNVISFSVFFGIWALSLANVHAILVAMQVIQDVLFLHFGLIVFIVMQAIAIAIKNRDAHALSEQLAEDLGHKSAELERQAQELKRLDRLKNSFLANTSHELQTPLNGIIGLAESLLDQDKSNLQQRHHINLITYSAKRLYNLVSDILDFSKIQHHDIKLNLKSIHLSSIVNFVLVTSRPLAKEKSIKLINHVANDLLPVMADEDRLQQILFNLIGNAIKFTEQGEVSVSAVHEGDYLKVSVADTGIGVPREEHRHIFDAFSQVDRSNAATYGGTGLGLTIVKQLVELHRGTITVDNRPTTGTVFSFTLPIIHTDSSELQMINQPSAKIRFIEPDPNVYPSEQANNELQEQNQATILIVDDESTNVQLISNHLSSNHYTVLVARNGAAALELLEKNKPDLVIMDLMMPIMNGFEATRKIRRLYSLTQLPIIILTVRSRLDDLIEGLNSGANDYLLKPFHKEELLARVRVHLNISRTKLVVEKFVPTDFFRHLEKESILDIQLGDNVEKEVNILFSDIRSFSSFSEQATSEEVFSFINSYLSKMGPLVRRYGGFIDQYVGDAIVALFDNSPDEALQSAIEMLSFLWNFNKVIPPDSNQFPIRIGIGLHAGKLRLGIIGEADRIQGGVIGDAVNLASRLQDMTKVYDTPLLISEDIFHALNSPENYTIRAIGRVKVKGRKKSIGIFEVITGDDPALYSAKQATMSLFQTGLECYLQGDLQQAKQHFETCFEKCPQDRAAKIYLSSCTYYLKVGFDASHWEGIPYLDTV